MNLSCAVGLWAKPKGTDTSASRTGLPADPDLAARFRRNPPLRGQLVVGQFCKCDPVARFHRRQRLAGSELRQSFEPGLPGTDNLAGESRGTPRPDLIFGARPKLVGSAVPFGFVEETVTIDG